LNISIRRELLTKLLLTTRLLYLVVSVKIGIGLLPGSSTRYTVLFSGILNLTLSKVIVTVNRMNQQAH